MGGEIILILGMLL